MVPRGNDRRADKREPSSTPERTVRMTGILIFIFLIIGAIAVFAFKDTGTEKLLKELDKMPKRKPVSFSESGLTRDQWEEKQKRDTWNHQEFMRRGHRFMIFGSHGPRRKYPEP